MSKYEFRQSISIPRQDEIPRPFGAKELGIEDPIVFRGGPFSGSRSSIIPLARLVPPSIKYGPRLTPSDLEVKSRAEDCPFCYPGRKYLQDPRYTWCEAEWCPSEEQQPKSINEKLFIGVRPDYYSHYQNVIFRTDQHTCSLKDLITKEPSFIGEFLSALKLRAQKLVNMEIKDSLLIGGISFGISWEHFHLNLGVCPDWTAAASGFDRSYWNDLSAYRFIKDFEDQYREKAKECETARLKSFPKNASLIVENSPSFLWVVAFAGRSENECTIISNQNNSIVDMENDDIQELSKIIWTLLCYYQSIGAGDGKFLLGFTSRLQEKKKGGGFVFEMMPMRKQGYIETFHGSYILGDWPENTAARLRGFKVQLLDEFKSGNLKKEPNLD